MAFVMTSIALAGLATASTVYEVRSFNSSCSTPSSSCVVNNFTDIATAVANCTNIVLQDISAPANQSIDLSGLLDHATVTFSGTTSFGFSPDHIYVPITIGGNYVAVTGAEGHVIEGNGAVYWDGQGSNGGLPKPNHMVDVKNCNNSIISDLYIHSYPVHCFSINSSSNLTLTAIMLNNTEGDAPNAASGTKAAGHNSDGFGIAGSIDVVLKDNFVYNQDDCVAITSGDSITVTNMYCSGGHGLSIGSIGGKASSTNSVSNVLIENSRVLNSSNGVRIKTNYNTTGYVGNVTYSNIILDGITDYGLDIQQDYLNGGPTGSPSNGVIIENILMTNVTGTVALDGINYYVLCGEGSCSNIVFENVSIMGGAGNSSCNYPSTGCP